MYNLSCPLLLQTAVAMPLCCLAVGVLAGWQHPTKVPLTAVLHLSAGQGHPHRQLPSRTDAGAVIDW
jgi:uncharacterized membrane protein YgaE (UPF0421/DUF939 family)